MSGSSLVRAMPSPLNALPMALAAAFLYDLWCNQGKNRRGLGIAGLLATLANLIINYANAIGELAVDVAGRVLAGVMDALNALGLSLLNPLMNWLQEQLTWLKGWLKKTGAFGYLCLAIVSAKILLSVVRR